MIVVQRIFNPYLRGLQLQARPQATAAKPEMTAEAKQIVLKEIGAKWGKSSEQDVSALKGNDDLVNKVVAQPGRSQVRPREGPDSARCGCFAERPSYLTLTANGQAEAASAGGLGRIYRPATAMEGDKNGCM
jgi:hypothetical protein